METTHSKAGALLIFCLIFPCCFRSPKGAPMSIEAHSVRTYLPFGEKLDPANVLTLADLELSTALASGLVEWDESRQVSAALADRWEQSGPQMMRFHLRAGAVWSDGQPIVASQYKRALERAKREYGESLRSLFDVLASIECPDESTLAFKLTVSVAESGLLKKLTEPMYGLVSTTSDGKLDLSRSSGPYVVASATKSEIALRANARWWGAAPSLVGQVLIRPTAAARPDGRFEMDEWANLFTSTSLLSPERLAALKASGFSIWQRSFDKLFFLVPSERFLKAHGPAAFKAIASRIDVKHTMKGFGGYSEARQVFPRGYSLYEPAFVEAAPPANTALDRPVELMMVGNDSGSALRDGLSGEIERVTGHRPHLTTIKPTEIGTKLSGGQFDVYAGSLAVADPNYEGAVTFFFSAHPPVFPSGVAPNDFAEQIASARRLPTEEEKGRRLKEIVLSAVRAGFVQPLFHFSSLTLAKPGLDLTRVPPTDEVVAFAKIRTASGPRR
jgi:hypothetical protein